MSQAEVAEAERLKSMARRSSEEGADSAFEQKFIRWLAQHPELGKSPELASVVREIGLRWYRWGREDGRKSALKLERER